MRSGTSSNPFEDMEATGPCPTGRSAGCAGASLSATAPPSPPDRNIAGDFALMRTWRTMPGWTTTPTPTTSQLGL